METKPAVKSKTTRQAVMTPTKRPIGVYEEPLEASVSETVVVPVAETVIVTTTVRNLWPQTVHFSLSDGSNVGLRPYEHRAFHPSQISSHMEVLAAKRVLVISTTRK